MLFVQDLRLFSGILQLLILCNSCLPNITMILQLSFQVFLCFSMNNYAEVEALLDEQMLDLEKQLYPFLIPNDDIQRLLWIPGIGKMNAFTILLEIDDINRFPDVKNFFSYCRLVPSARNSGGKSKQRSSKDGNKYLKVAFSDAAVHAVQYYPVIRKYQQLFNQKEKQTDCKNHYC